MFLAAFTVENSSVFSNVSRTIEFDESPIPDNTYRSLGEVRVRRNGCVWAIHKSDADPFPSNPHAHNMESGLKLDLSNGRLWFGTRDTTGQLEYIRRF